MDREEIADVIEAEIERRGWNSYRAAVESALPEDAFRYLKQGRNVGIGRLSQMCDALGLELYVGPPRAHPAASDLCFSAPKHRSTSRLR